jgi:DNA-binding CsgD family transcriptional regulator
MGVTTIRTVSQKEMLRSVAARHAEGLGWVPADELLGHGRAYDRARTVAALVEAGWLERTSDGAVYAYRATPAGIAWVARDGQRDSLGRRRGGMRSVVPAEKIDRARQLLSERSQGKPKYRMQEVADLVGLSRHTLSMHLYPGRHKRRLELRRARHKKEEMMSIDHTGCIPTETAGFPRAHTHEGQKGTWLFPSEATREDLETAESSEKKES